MNEVTATERLNFLAKKFEIFETEPEKVKAKINELKSQGFLVMGIETETMREKKVSTALKDNKSVLALVYMKEKMMGEDQVRNICVSLDVFTNIIAADPTPNKSCVQWMLNTFIRYLKENDEAHAIRFVNEDLPQANEYITLFEANKRKQKFKRLCNGTLTIKHIEDPSDINQFKSLSQLYDAVDPFIERKPTELESLLLKYVEAGQAQIPIRDRKFTLYVPLSNDASTVFGKFASWCTARPENSMFNSYTDQKTPMGTRSKLYIIINNKFFTGASNELYQLHFESRQLKDRQNASANVIQILEESDGMKLYFREELLTSAKAKKSMEGNLYLDYLMEFGFCNSIFELHDDDVPFIKFMNKVIKELPDMSRFRALDCLIITDGELTSVHESIGKLRNLEMLVLRSNKIKTLPKEIGQLKNLTYLNLVDNPIEDLPEEIKYLDKSNGGILTRIALDKNKVDQGLLKKLRRLMPKTILD